MRRADSRGWSLRGAEPPMIGGELPTVWVAVVPVACGRDEAAVKARTLGTLGRQGVGHAS